MENLINRHGDERTIERISHNRIRVMGNSQFTRKSSDSEGLTMFDFEGGPCLNVGGKIKFEKLEWYIDDIVEEKTPYSNFASIQLSVSPIF
jgi:hypothetical protein